ncbi:unnamed protein product, partial [Larinioides sclopetarius]
MMRSLPYSAIEYPKTVRLDIQLIEPDDSSYNSVSYAKLLNLQLGKNISNSDLLGLTTEDTYDRFKDYEEESYIDNSEVYRDTLPAGKEPMLGGFYINTGKLELKSSIVAPNSIGKNKNEEKKKVSVKTKAAQTKTIRKKKTSRSKAKKPKHKKTKISVDHNMYSNIRLDALLKTVRKQKKNGHVKSINLPNTSKHSSFSRASKKAKEICKITPKKKVHFTKKCFAETSDTSKVILNSTEVIIPREDFLSSKTDSIQSLSSTSDPDEVEILKEIVHSGYKKNNEHTFAKNNLAVKTVMTSESVQVGTSKDLYSPSAIISKELGCLSLNPNFVSPSPILDLKKEFPKAASEKAFRSSSKVAVEPDFISLNPALKTAEPRNLHKATALKNMDSNRKVNFDSTLEANSSMPNTAVRSSFSNATSAFACSSSSKATTCLSSSKATSAFACSSSSKTTSATACLSSSKATSAFGCPSSSKTTSATACLSSSNATSAFGCPSSSKPTKAPIHSSSSKVIIKPVRSSSPKVIIKPVRSSSPKVNIKPVRSNSCKSAVLKEEFHSSCYSTLGYAFFQDVPLAVPESNSTKSNIKPINSGSSKEVISAVHASSYKAISPKEKHYSSRKVPTDSTFIANNPILNEIHSSSKTGKSFPKRVRFSSSVTEFDLFQDIPLTKTVEDA